MVDTRSRIDFPQSRRAPKEVIQRLREIDPNAELIYFGGGRWVLGVYNPNRDRINAARKRLAVLSRHPQAARDMVHGDRLNATGFRPIEWYTVQGEPGAEIVEDFRLRDFNFRNRADQLVHQRIHDTSDVGEAERRQKRAESWIDATAGDAWRHAFKKPHSVS